jgi:hypothetical protein
VATPRGWSFLSCGGFGPNPNVKTALIAFLGATPLLTKLIAIALLGRPTINFLKKHSFKLFRRSVGGGD